MILRYKKNKTHESKLRRGAIFGLSLLQHPKVQTPNSKLTDQTLLYTRAKHKQKEKMKNRERNGQQEKKEQRRNETP